MTLPSQPGSIRTYGDAIAPTWLKIGTAQLKRGDWTLGCDGILEKMQQGQFLHIPTYGDATGLPPLGDDRSIPQGPNEPNSNYALRLQQAYIDWGFAGMPRAVMHQETGFLFPFVPRMRTVSDSGTWHTYSEGANTALPPARWLVSPDNWNWDGNSYWWRMWLIVYATTQTWVGPGPKWGPGLKQWGDPSFSWGLNCPSSTITGMRAAILKTFKAQHAYYVNLIISFDDSLFDPAYTGDGVHNPDGTFGNWSKIVTIAGVRTRVSARFDNARYCDGAI